MIISDDAPKPTAKRSRSQARPGQATFLSLALFSWVCFLSSLLSLFPTPKFLFIWKLIFIPLLLLLLLAAPQQPLCTYSDAEERDRGNKNNRKSLRR